MKLAGPRKRVDFVLHRSSLEARISGFFPPERAAARRTMYQAAADDAYPFVKGAYDRARRRYIEELLYGTMDTEPAGILVANLIVAT
ncbi:MAG TPA: hypothetical protein VIR54_17735 [Vicinamibacterales bacterium]